jgi:two-component system, NarL family, response regulator LiaR
MRQNTAFTSAPEPQPRHRGPRAVEALEGRTTVTRPQASPGRAGARAGTPPGGGGSDPEGTGPPDGRRADSEPNLRVIIADDDPLARRFVKSALQGAGMTVVAEASNGQEAAELAIYYKPDCVLMDLVMPGVDGLEATRRIMERAPGIRVVMLTASDEDAMGLLGLRTGACGFINKEIAIDALPRTLRATLDGEAAISRRLTMLLIERYRRTREDGLGMRPVRSTLTAREWEVLDLLCAGANTESIAEELVLSPETVRSHVKNLLRKLGVKSRREAVLAAHRLREQGSDIEAHPPMNGRFD